MIFGIVVNHGFGKNLQVFRVTLGGGENSSIKLSPDPYIKECRGFPQA